MRRSLPAPARPGATQALRPHASRGGDWTSRTDQSVGIKRIFVGTTEIMKEIIGRGLGL